MNYSKPPIIEAVIEFQFAGDCTPADRVKVARKLKKRYPVEETVQEMVIESDAAGIRHSMAPIGVRLTSSDRTENFNLSGQAQGIGGVPGDRRPAAVSVSQLAPYSDWEEFSGRFIQDWGVVEKVLGHRKLQRVGVRFINRIDIPRAIEDFGQWVRIGLAFPAELSRPTTFSLQTVIPVADSVQANIFVGSVPSPLPGYSAIMLDIDVYTTTGDISDRPEERMEMLSRFQVLKNHIFENCVTDAARELFE